MIKTITIDHFYTKEEAIRLSRIVQGLTFVDSEFGTEIENFNMVGENADEMFSTVLRFPVIVDKDKSGVFRYPKLFNHFEQFNKIGDWCFSVALQSSTFNLFYHESGIQNALEQYKFNYRNLFEWDLKVNYLLEPGQGIFFRPWLFHSFDTGLIQMFRLTEVSTNDN